MSTDALIHKIFEDYELNHKSLIDRQELSFANDYKNQSAKVVLLACASFFESKILEEIIKVLNTTNCDLTKNFLLNKTLIRQYHTLFDWNGANANSFFKLFGEEYSKYMKDKIKSDKFLEQAIKDFLELGSLRNQLVHCNYATFKLELTIEDIKAKFESAQNFVNAINVLSDEFKISLSLKSGPVA